MRKVFKSYYWLTPDHQKKVVKLAKKMKISQSELVRKMINGWNEPIKVGFYEKTEENLKKFM